MCPAILLRCSVLPMAKDGLLTAAEWRIPDHANRDNSRMVDLISPLDSRNSYGSKGCRFNDFRNVAAFMIVQLGEVQ
jgi:hypothetical protein